MNITLETKPLPLQLGDDGVIRVSNTRMTLDTIIETFSCGSTPEEIALTGKSDPEIIENQIIYLPLQ